MKTYEKPGISLVRLLPEERIAANPPVKWIWIEGTGPDQNQVNKKYMEYFGLDVMPYMDWDCGWETVAFS